MPNAAGPSLIRVGEGPGAPRACAKDGVGAMNFLAHYVYATRCALPADASPDYVLGNALPDLLPLAAPRARFRRSTLESAPPGPVKAGVVTHLRTDTAFHKTQAFGQAQADVKSLFRAASFPGMRLRPFFLAHVLAELCLDAVLLRADPGLADDFYAAFAAADFIRASRWSEATLGVQTPGLPAVLSHFARSRYLTRYAEDGGVAEGLTRLCARARQDAFTGGNAARLTALVADAVSAVAPRAPALFAETHCLVGNSVPEETP